MSAAALGDAPAMGEERGGLGGHPLELLGFVAVEDKPRWPPSLRQQRSHWLTARAGKASAIVGLAQGKAMRRERRGAKGARPSSARHVYD